MNDLLTANQISIRDSIARVCSEFGPDYWLQRDEDGQFPKEFHRRIADGGWLGITLPVEYGGTGLGDAQLPRHRKHLRCRDKL